VDVSSLKATAGTVYQLNSDARYTAATSLSTNASYVVQNGTSTVTVINKGTTDTPDYECRLVIDTGVNGFHPITDVSFYLLYGNGIRYPTNDQFTCDVVDGTTMQIAITNVDLLDKAIGYLSVYRVNEND
jgi:hypothetical protein